jgi:CelD/BcsL family acetyltransferase involved in cellulose biosynthesis
LGLALMASKSQRKATRAHRRRATASGLVRVEVQAPKKDAGLIRALAERLRKAENADTLRSTLAKALAPADMKTAFDIFGSELGDEAFGGVFDQPRQQGWRDVDL